MLNRAFQPRLLPLPRVVRTAAEVQRFDAKPCRLRKRR